MSKKTTTALKPSPVEYPHIAKSLWPLVRPLPEASLDPANARTGHDLDGIGASLRLYGQRTPIVINISQNGKIEKGNGTWQAANALGWETLAMVLVEDDPVTATGYALADNRLSDKSAWDYDTLGALLESLPDDSDPVPGFDPDFLDSLESILAGGGDGDGADYEPGPTLADRFLVPPFSVLDARQGYWQDRKRVWLSLGIKSELGRGRAFESLDSAIAISQQRVDSHVIPPDEQALAAGVSVFDPVLCELVYRWFSPPGGLVLDFFAGGSVRGIVAALVGRPYTGIDLRAEQVEANKTQAAQLVKTRDADDARLTSDPQALTPVDQVGDGLWAKRDDLFCVAGARGGKARTAWELAQGASGLVTAGSRHSPQVNIVAHVARKLGVPCRVHTPTGELSAEVLQARDYGAEVLQHKPGYNSVIIARAREDAKSRGWLDVPFGMECQAAIDLTRLQVANIPPEVKRLVVPVGSGMSLAGILWGLKDKKSDLPVLGVCVGADPAKRLDKYAPPDWAKRVQLVESKLDYHEQPKETTVGGLGLDPIYEAKCIPMLQHGDCLWVVGIRATATGGGAGPLPTWLVGDSRDLDELLGDTPPAYDLLFTCPPYFDLEVYSDDPQDLSNAQTYDEFMVDFGAIVEGAVKRLKDDRFAVCIVADIRDKAGFYRNFVSDTIGAFEAAGARLYNEAILITAIGSLPVRAGRQFEIARKLGKAHQNILVFIKGDPKAAVKALGPVDLVFEQGTLADSGGPFAGDE